MKNIYMVQVCDSFGAGQTEARYLPYTAGVLVAAAFADAEIRSNYCFMGFCFRRDDIDRDIEAMKDPAA